MKETWCCVLIIFILLESALIQRTQISLKDYFSRDDTEHQKAVKIKNLLISPCFSSVKKSKLWLWPMLNCFLILVQRMLLQEFSRWEIINKVSCNHRQLVLGGMQTLFNEFFWGEPYSIHTALWWRIIKDDK